MARADMAVVLLGYAFGCGPATLVDEDVEEPCRFASQVLAYDPSHAGAPAPTHPSYADPTAALGEPDYDPVTETGAVALGSGGLLELAFDGCEFGSNGHGRPDLRVFEVGPFYERTFVSVRVSASSRDRVAAVVQLPDDHYLFVGNAEGGVSDLDLDERLPELATLEAITFDAVRLVDDPAQGAWGPGKATGADIDAVELLSP